MLVHRAGARRDHARRSIMRWRRDPRVVAGHARTRRSPLNQSSAELPGEGYVFKSVIVLRFVLERSRRRTLISSDSPMSFT
jgi:hypothetical protein